ncbi:MAG: sugar ABC transporter substrate-binding protein [bacterium]|nr:sugar ABC transporter substrate-binding protein [bacterium]MDE0290379.1 sugar ABC transporter substrate-binding protein [bacterium]MDE0437194.1 sugar ABC transporter substrate-binding protein [bacterium]
MTKRRWAVALAVLALAFAACGGGEEAAPEETAAPAATEAATTTEAPTTVAVTPTQSSDLTFHMVTHSDDGVFWSVVKKGAQDAADALGVEMVWSPSSNDPEKQVQDMQAAVASASDGIGVSLANPQALGPEVQAAIAAGIPVITLNSGSNQFKELGAITHVGQTEIVAGEGAGEFFNDLGAGKVLCAQQEQGNIGLEERCQGLEATFNGEVVTQFVGLDAEPETQINTIAAALQADTDIDGVLGVGPNVAVRAVEAGNQAGRDLYIGGFDISNDLIAAIEAGDVNFTVDQQQYLQGYLTIVFLYLNATNLNTVGGGLPVLTGPGFVTTENVGQVKALVDQGTR